MIKKLLLIEKIIDFHKNNSALPKYKLEQFIDYKKQDYKYEDIKSNKQITTIIQNSKKHDNYTYLKLLSLLAKHSNTEDLSIMITNIMSLPLSDTDIFRIMKKMRQKKVHKHKHSYGPCPIYISNRKKKVDLLKHNILPILKKENFKLKRYLDFGCGDCKLTKEYGVSLDVKAEDIYGADLRKWFNYETKKRKNVEIKFVEIEEKRKYNFEDNFFSLISCFMVLHHVKDLDFVLKELNRITQMNGYIYVTEHQTVSNTERMLCDIEHSIYEISYREHSDYHKDFFSNYYHWIEWDIIFAEYGFEMVKGNVLYYNITEEPDPTKKAWMLYKKIKNLK